MTDDSRAQEAEFLKSFNEAKDVIYKIGRLYFNDEKEREDFVQDVLVNAWRAFPKFRGASTFSTWIYRISINTAYFHLRQRMVRDLSAEALINQSIEPNNQNLERLHIAAESLNENEKSLLGLYLQDLKYNEIAEVLGITINLVGVRISRLKEKLKSIVEKKRI